MKLLVVCFVALLALGAFAKKDKIEDSDRDVSIDHSDPKDFTITSDNTDAKAKYIADSLKLKIQTTSGSLQIWARFDGEEKESDDDSKSESESKSETSSDKRHDGEDHGLEYRVVLSELREFNKPTGAYIEGDTVLSTVAFSASNWSPLTTPTTDANGLTTFSVTYSEGSLSVKFDFFLSKTPFTVGTSTVPSTGLKFTMTISGYNYVGNPSKLALIGTVFSKGGEAEHDDESPIEARWTMDTSTESESESESDDEDEIHINKPATPFSGFYNWASTLETPAGCAVLPQMKAGASGSGSSENSYKAYFTFDCANPATIVWDPTVGFRSPASTLIASALLVLAALVVAF